MRHLMTTAFAGIAVMLAAGCETEPRTDDPVGIPRAEALSDHEFVQLAASTDMFEIQSAQLALQKDVSPQTEQVAQTLIEDHRRSSQELRQIAEQEGISVPQQMEPHFQNLYEDLEALEGQEFEQRFGQVQYAAHLEAIELFERAAGEVDSPELRQFAQRHLPGLRDHLQMVQQLPQPAQPN